MDIESVRKKGIEEINTAIELDEKNSHEEALNYYIKGIATLMVSIKYTKNEKLKKSVMVKIIDYFDRAETIKHSLKKKSISDDESPESDHDEVPSNVDTNTMKETLLHTVMRGTGVSFDDVVGIKQTKDALIEAVILPKKFPSMFSGNRKPWNAIMMYGPPGTGKSFLAKAVATEAESAFFSVSSSDIISKWQGESEKMIKTLFEVARENKPSVIFIDEIDSIAGERDDNENDSTRRIKTQLLIEMQGVASNNDGVLILAATNTPWTIDTAFRRRFQKRVYVGLPDKSSRIAMFKRVFEDENFDFNKLGELTDGYSGSDISNVIRESLMVPIRKCRNAKQFIAVDDNKYMPLEKYPNCVNCPLDLSNDPSNGKVCDFCGACCKTMDQLTDETLQIPPVTYDDIVNSLQSMQKSVSDVELKRYVEWTNKFGQDGN